MYDPERITFFAKTDARGKNVPFGIKAKDRTRHVYVIGKTGMGKSTLLENMAVQDIRNGEGLAFIDPHGQTAEKLLEYIPEERKKDVLYFAPHDLSNPVSFNVMEDVGADKRHLVVSGLMSVFEKIWVDAWSARMAYILQNTLMALLEYPDSTLMSVNRMLSDKEYRQKVVDNVTDPSVKSFWVDEFAKYTDRFAAEATPAIQNKIGQFTSNPVIRNIIGQPRSSFDIRKIMDEKKILIMNLSKGLIGESNANLLGSMLTTRIYLAAMSRADLPLEQMERMPNFYFYVDEFQSFANSTFANILSEARKYKLNLTIAHQYIEQMEEEVKNAVFGNVGTVIAFRVGPFDAEVLETIFSPRFLAADIVNLGFAQIYLTLMIDGIGSAPFSAVTMPPLEPEAVSYKDMVIAESRRQFASDRGSVEQKISAWHEDGRAAAPPPRAPRSDSSKRKERTGPPPDTSQRSVSETRPRRSDPKPESNGSREQKPRQGAPAERSEPRAPTHKNLDDLRSVLASISKTSDEQKNDKPQKREAKQEHPKTPQKQGDLKGALAAVLKDQKSEVKPEEKPAPKPVSAPPEGPEEDRTLDPKRLERMMRVNTSDKTPLK
ncbi:MAG: type IV secretion system DNA-binding domain-containing protein [Candidatus Paceibacterota bacterium]